MASTMAWSWAATWFLFVMGVSLAMITLLLRGPSGLASPRGSGYEAFAAGAPWGAGRRDSARGGVAGPLTPFLEEDSEVHGWLRCGSHLLEVDALVHGQILKLAAQAVQPHLDRAQAYPLAAADDATAPGGDLRLGRDG